MEQFIADLRRRQEKELTGLEERAENEMEKIEGAINILVSSLGAIQEFLLQYSFEDIREEIHFFKSILPSFQSELIYYSYLQKLAVQKPEGAISQLKKYHKKQLKKITGFFKEYRVFYEYYRSGEGYLDERYFCRGKADAATAGHLVSVALDGRYSTPGSFTLSTLLAQKRLQVYLTEQLIRLEGSENSPGPKHFGIEWTDTNMALAEQIYAWYYKGSFNHGKAELKKLQNFIEYMFGVSIGNIYKAKQEMYGRSNISSYLDILRKRFRDGMEDSEERPGK